MPHSSSSAPLYVTTTLPYVNADPHLGFAFEFTVADIFVRYHRRCGREVFFNTGTDEHGLKVYRKALEEKKDPAAYVLAYAGKYKKLIAALGITADVHFVRTTDSSHTRAVAAFWGRCRDRGFIYKKKYRIKYCVDCELEKTESELVDGRCAIHPNHALEIIEEENYFFKFSAFREVLLDLYRKRPAFVVPEVRFNEVRVLVERGLEDFSISRLTEKLPWGVPVPDDPTQTVYVWFDALVSYISAIGWPDEEQCNKWLVDSGGVIQFAGKDQIRQQAAMWQAMLHAANLPFSKQIVIHGFITSGGKKMSKSLGNVVDPFELVKDYGIDAVRFFLARHVNPFEDSDFTIERFQKAYNADLANGLGNLTSRILKMSQEQVRKPPAFPSVELPKDYTDALEHYDFQAAVEYVWGEIGQLDRRIQETEPFKLVTRDPQAAIDILKELAVGLDRIAELLIPILPETAAKIKTAVGANRMPTTPLFPRKE